MQCDYHHVNQQQCNSNKHMNGYGNVGVTSWMACCNPTIATSTSKSTVSTCLSGAIKNYFKGFDKLTWNCLLSLTKFTLSLNASCDSWRKWNELCRRLKGELNHAGLTLACHDARSLI